MNNHAKERSLDSYTRFVQGAKWILKDLSIYETAINNKVCYVMVLCKPYNLMMYYSYQTGTRYTRLDDVLQLPDWYKIYKTWWCITATRLVQDIQDLMMYYSYQTGTRYTRLDDVLQLPDWYKIYKTWWCITATRLVQDIQDLMMYYSYQTGTRYTRLDDVLQLPDWYKIYKTCKHINNVLFWIT